MLLKSHDISYCQLVWQFGTTSAIVSGVSYQGNLFMRGNSYPLQQRQVAITEMRRNFLDPEPATACLLVEDGNIVTIWHEDRGIIKAVETAKEIMSYLNLAELVARMRSSQGVEVKTRWQSFRLPYKRCFIGSEAVTWLTLQLSIDRHEAEILGQQLMDENLIYHILGKERFKDAALFYQFAQDRQTNSD